MRAQHSCFGFQASETDGLFFGLFPEPNVARRLERNAQQLCIRHRLAARALAPERLHVSLLGFGHHAGLPRDFVTAVIEVAETIAIPPFEATFDRVVSFIGRTRPLVLCGGEGVEELVMFQRHLSEAIQKNGLGRLKTQYMPHITLLYDAHGIEEHAIEPVRWIVKEFVLVHSLLGRSSYVPLGRWPLRGR